MSESVRIVLDGHPAEVTRTCSAKKPDSLLRGLLALGVEVPTMCYHPALGGDGRCGLCVVEVLAEGEWVPRLSCQVQVAPNMVVRTHSAAITHLRAHSASLLLGRGPFRDTQATRLLEELAAADPSVAWTDPRPSKEASTLPVTTGRAVRPAALGCILCGLCVRMCDRTGRSLLTLMGRAHGTWVGMVAGDGPGMSCGSCSACSRVCPTGFIYPDAASTFTRVLYRPTTSRESPEGER